MDFFTEKLPDTRTSVNNRCRWLPGVGELLITTGRTTCRYLVTESKLNLNRVFLLRKLDNGSDREKEEYEVNCNRVKQLTCNCKGYFYSGNCKHTAAVQVMLDSEQL